MNKITLNHIDDIHESHDRLKYFDSSLLKHDAHAIQLSMEGECYSQWADATVLMFDKVREIFPAHQYAMDALINLLDLIPTFIQSQIIKTPNTKRGVCVPD